MILDTFSDTLVLQDTLRPSVELVLLVKTSNGNRNRRMSKVIKMKLMKFNAICIFHALDSVRLLDSCASVRNMFPGR